MKFSRFTYIAWFILCSLSGSAFAQSNIYGDAESESSSGVVKPQGHYQKWTYGDSEVSKTDPLIAQPLRSYDKKEEERGKQAENKRAEKKPKPTPAQQNAPQPKNPLNMSKDEFSKYAKELAGDSSEKPFIRPSENAPGEFQVMQACLQRQDYECANKYAEKYIKANVISEQLHTEVRKLTESKLRKQGLLPNSIESEEPDYENLELFGSGDVSAKPKVDEQGKPEAISTDEDQKINAGPSVGQLPSTVQALLREGEQREDQYVNKNRAEIRPPKEDDLGGGELLRMLSIPEDKQRKQANDLYKNSLTKDTNGAARVYFFFRHDDLNAFAMLPVLERVYQAHKDDKGFIMLAFSLSSMTSAELSAMKNKTHVSFPLRSGSAIAKQMEISQSPTILVVAPSSGNFAKEQGVRGFGFVDELVRLVDGSAAPKKSG